MSVNISGFPELLPSQQESFAQIIDALGNFFSLHGFIPFNSTAVEKIETLLAKGNDNEIYGIQRIADEKIKRKLGLRFDLTIPLSRYVAHHYSNLTFPYRRYQIAPVWRGERPQSGRYREFYQCDLDVIGNRTLSLHYDAEMLFMICQGLKILQSPNFTIKINHCLILESILLSLEVPKDNISSVARVLDKLAKVPLSTIKDELIKLKMNQKSIDIFFSLQKEKNVTNLIPILKQFQININENLSGAIEELIKIVDRAKTMGIVDSNISFDISLARGLNYYTGLIYETYLNDYQEIGSICSGGRYDNLATNFSKQQLPGVGFSIGLTRLFQVLSNINHNYKKCTSVLVTCLNHQYLAFYQNIANYLRCQNINTELYLEEKPLKEQMKYANKRNFDFAIIIDDSILSSKGNNEGITVRNLKNGDQFTASLEKITKIITSDND